MRPWTEARAALLALSLVATAAASATTGLIAIDKVGNRIRFLDPVTLQEQAVLISPEPNVHELAISTDQKWAYVPLYGNGIYGSNTKPNNKIIVIDLARREITKVIDLGQYVAPHGMAATRDGKLWVACDQQAKLLLVDPVAGRVEAAYDAPGKGPHFIALLPDETKLYLSNKEGALAVFDPVRRTFLASVPITAGAPGTGNGSGTEGLAASPDGRRLLIADNDRSEIHVIDTATDHEIGRFALRMMPLTTPRRTRLVRLKFSPDGRTVVITGYATGLAWIIDTANYSRQRVVPVAKGPQGIAFAPDGRSVLIASHDDATLTRIDLRSAKPIAQGDGGDGIEVLAFF